MLRRRVAGPFLLLLIVSGFYWKLVTKQYTWLDEPDLAYQVLPWYQYEAVSWHQGDFPLWDPHDWGGQPLIGQLQPGAAYPPNWLLFLLPLKDGHIQQVWLNLYFILTHWLAALFCYCLCLDLKLSPEAAVLGGLGFALGGVTGNLGWPQMLNGAIWLPLVVLFTFRWLRGRHSFASAAIGGTFAGLSILSGHHQIPMFMLLLTFGFAVYDAWRNKAAAIKPIIAFVSMAFLTGALQLLPAYEYGIRSIRWVGLPYGIYWGQKVPYSVHEQYSLPPIGILGLVLPHLTTYDTFMGIALCALALLGFSCAMKHLEVRLLGAALVGSILFALGGMSVFHGTAYLLLPMLDKSRTPALAVVIAQFAIAGLAAFGLDALSKEISLAKSWKVSLSVAGVLPWPVLAFSAALRPEAGREYEHLAIFGLVALAVAAILHARTLHWLTPAAVSVLLIGVVVFELGTVTGDNYRNRDRPGGYLSELSKNQDVISFLRSQADFERLELDPSAAPANLGDWYGLDVMQAYLGGVTANVAQLESEPVQDGRLAQRLFSLTHYLGSKPVRAGQQELFRGKSGLVVFRNPDPLPPMWTVHEALRVASADLVKRLVSTDLRTTVLLDGDAPALEACSGDEVHFAQRRDAKQEIDAHMACRGMIILSDTFFPGWQAKIDDKVAPMWQADGALRGVVVGGGTHHIEVAYRPMSVYAGGVLTASGLLVSVVVALKAVVPARKA